MEKTNEKNIQPTYIGGQAVIEGVMMRGKKMFAMAVRNQEKEIQIIKQDIKNVSDKYKIFKLPIFRGMVSFVNSLVMGMKIITLSAELAGLDTVDDEPPSKFEKFLIDKCGEKLNDYLITFSVVIAIFFSIGLFMLLPVWLGSFFNPILNGNTGALSFIEGSVRIIIFLLYILLISRQKEVRRIFEYHGAEHKTINCFEHKEELTIANVKKHSRLHKRCGTSFLLIVMVVSMIVFFFIKTKLIWLRLLSRILLVPFIAGISYEIIKWAGKSDNLLVNIISYPGMCLQKITTSEPDDSEIEVAIRAMEGVLESEQS